MSWLKNLGKWIGYLINPAGAIIGNTLNSQIGTQATGYSPDRNVQEADNPSMVSTGKGFWEKIWDDLMGKSQIELQNQLNRELAEEEYQRNLQSIGDTAAAYEAAGFNRNLMYNQSPAQYNAPNLTAYSGSQKIDKILQRTGQVLGMIPAMYQATAALEGIDQARERTKQSEIKTMSMGMSLLDQGYKLGNVYFKNPFNVDLGDFSIGKRHFDPSDYGKYFHPQAKNFTFYSPDGKSYQLFGNQKMYDYADAALKNQFDLLASIGIKNQMNSTLNNWRGYQYSLDRRFGAAGRIVGMGSQGLRAVGSLFSPIKLFGK